MLTISTTNDRQRSMAPRLSERIARALLRSSDLRQSLVETAQILADELGVDLVRIWLFHGITLELAASAGRPIDDGNALIAGGQFSVGYVARLAEPYFSNNIRSDPRLHDKEWAHRNGLRSFAGIPIMLAGKPEGILAVFDARPISNMAVEQLGDACENIALAIERIQSEAKEAMARAVQSDAQADNAREHAVVVTTADGHVADWSAVAEKLFGLSRIEAIGLPIEKAILFETPISHDEWIRQLSSHECATLLHMVRRRQDDITLHIQMTISRLDDPDGAFRGTVVVAHDLAELDRLRLAYQYAQKAGIIGSFMGAITHDFNNLLTIIQGYGEFLKHYRFGEEQPLEWLTEITKAAKKGEALVRQILDMGRKRPPSPVVLDLNTIVEDLETSLTRMVREDITVTVRKSPQLRAVVVDPGHIHQVLLNLVINACDAMPHGGSLTIETQNVDYVPQGGESRTLPIPSYCVGLSVSDTGVGMDPATRARIFEPYFTTKGPGIGTGMGLSNAQAIVKQYGGWITVDSEPGQGTTFRVHLPANSEAHMVTDTLPTPSVSAAGTETILLVEDSDAVRHLIHRVLRDEGYNVLSAGNGEEALSIANAAKEPIHLVIADVIMPQLGGSAFAEKLKEIVPAAKVLFISGHTDDVVAAAGIDSERSFLGKPFTNAALARRVREMLDEPV